MMGMVQSKWFFSIPQGNKSPEKKPFRQQEEKKFLPPRQIQGLAILMPETKELGVYWVACTQQREFHAIGDTQLSAFVDVNMVFS